MRALLQRSHTHCARAVLAKTATYKRVTTRSYNCSWSQPRPQGAAERSFHIKRDNRPRNKCLFWQIFVDALVKFPIFYHPIKEYHTNVPKVVATSVG